LRTQRGREDIIKSRFSDFSVCTKVFLPGETGSNKDKKESEERENED
jgi:hypothetical protein